MADIHVVNSSYSLDIIEGSNHGNLASDYDERMQHALAAVCPLNDQESILCSQLYR